MILKQTQHHSHAENEELKNQIRQDAIPLQTEHDLDSLIESIGDSQFVLLGESTHGTHEYYLWRMKISQRLIQEKGFTIIAVEGDWPECFRINRFIKHAEGSPKSAMDTLKMFNRWPTWMWANWEMLAFVEWLKKHNTHSSEINKVSFYGLDVYSFRESLSEIIEFLKKYDKNTFEIADRALNCFNSFGSDDGQSYGKTAGYFSGLCEKEVNQLLQEIRKNKFEYLADKEQQLSTEQNAHIAVNSEKYYRSMYKGGAEAWNIRDTHMFETIERLIDFHGEKSKIIIWEHNTHVGDARATDMKDDGMINLGQLIKEAYSEKGVFTVGFGSFEGTVTAAYNWGSKSETMQVPKSKKGSWEFLMNEATDAKDAYIKFHSDDKGNSFDKPFGHRAIGVVYDSEYESFGNYVPSIMSMRYDAFIFIAKTRALHPIAVESNKNQIPETYPFGF